MGWLASSQVPMGGLVQLPQPTTHRPGQPSIHPLTQSGGIDPLGFQNTQLGSHGSPASVVVAFRGRGAFPRFPVSFTRPHFGHAGRYD